MKRGFAAAAAGPVRSHVLEDLREQTGDGHPKMKRSFLIDVGHCFYCKLSPLAHHRPPMRILRPQEPARGVEAGGLVERAAARRHVPLLRVIGQRQQLYHVAANQGLGALRDFDFASAPAAAAEVGGLKVVCGLYPLANRADDRNRFLLRGAIYTGTGSAAFADGAGADPCADADLKRSDSARPMALSWPYASSHTSLELRIAL
jgi:hypothetical protein